jgi:hypothetical protein
MGHTRIEQQVLRLKEKASLPNGMQFPAGTEFEIVMDVVYMQGYPIPPATQNTVYNWLVSNSNLFTDDTRRF